MFHEFDVNTDDFIKNTSKDPIINGSGCVSFEIQKETNIRCAVKRKNETIEDENNKKAFTSAIKALSQYKYPSIVPFIGFSTKNNFGYIYLAEVQNGSLHSFIQTNQFNPNFNSTTKFIISYGIAKAMHHLSKSGIINLNLTTNNVLLDDKYYPFLTNFYSRPQKFDNTDSKFIAPEMIEGPLGSGIYADSYSYGMVLYELWTEVPAFVHIKSSNLIISAVQNKERPLIPSYLNENWRKLIESCWNPFRDSRPDFDRIVSELETDKYITDDMDREKIDEYKKIFSKPMSDESYMPNFGSKTEQKQDEENHVLIKLRKAAQAGDAASQFILAVGQFDGIFGHPSYDESLEYSMKYIRNCAERDAFVSIMEFYAGKCYVQLEKFESAEKLLRCSLNHGCREAGFLLAELIVKDKVKCKRTNEIEYLYKMAADAGIQKAI